MEDRGCPIIIFKTIRWQNFLSTGNTFTEINLNEVPNALIIGENGAGKSTILDALTFSLFGKPFRKINKSQLLNSVNEKNCLVEIEFSTNGKEYKVTRGMKPNVFEIYCDGVCLNQDSASKDYQEHLEQFILKMGYKCFCQIVILGSASFVPFMQLTPADRRAIIEDLLDIQIFTSMNIIAKKKLSENKENLEKNRLELAGKKEKKEFIQRNIDALTQNNKKKRKELADRYVEQQMKYDEIKLEIDALEVKKQSLMKQIESLPKIKQKHQKLLTLKTKIETNKNRHVSDITFYETNDSCPTCKQAIDQEFKQHETQSINVKISEFDSGLVEITKQIDSCIQDINDKNAILTSIGEIQNDISGKTSSLNGIINTQASLVNEIDTLESSNGVLSNNKDEMKSVLMDIEKLEKERQELIEQKQFIDTAIVLLKDGGIKTKIIKQYLPIINKHINKYLSQMGFFVNFHINENFEETIKSRYLDDFSYQNFSEGEKTRIDLAILFTWRTIAKLRNSVNCNLLIFDEIFDGSLDNSGTDEFLKIMWTMLEDTNTFVISHKTDQLVDKFKRVYRFKKHKNFSALA